MNDRHGHAFFILATVLVKQGITGSSSKQWKLSMSSNMKAPENQALRHHRSPLLHLGTVLEKTRTLLGGRLAHVNTSLSDSSS